MIVCPNCKEEIDDDSYYCDQCGQALLYCEKCGRVGIGRRCTSCGGLMIQPAEFQRRSGGNAAYGVSVSTGFASHDFIQSTRGGERSVPGAQRAPLGVPVLTLQNDSLNIRFQGINGAVIGRRQGPYAQYFQQNMFVSGVHAQLKYNSGSGWCISDKHSSNGTKLNEHPLQPDVEMSLKNGDILSIANVILQVSIKL